MAEGSFSKRHGFTPPRKLIHDEAPEGLRYAVVALARQDPLRSNSDIVRTVRLTLGLGTDPSRLAELDTQTAPRLLEACPWWKVFDIAEALYRTSRNQIAVSYTGASYEADLNAYCSDHDIGWEMVGGRWRIRASPEESWLADMATQALMDAEKTTSAAELQEALRDLSRRPQADLTGAIQHAGAAIECLARDLCGEPKLTLGEIIKRHPGLFPGAYKKLADAIWAIASNKGRHIEEGGEPTLEEAMLLVGVVAPLTRYMLDCRAVAELTSEVP